MTSIAFVACARRVPAHRVRRVRAGSDRHDRRLRHRQDRRRRGRRARRGENLDTGFTKETTPAADGFYRLLLLPVGQYSVTVEAPQFATLVREPIQVNVSQTVRVNVQLELPSRRPRP